MSKAIVTIASGTHLQLLELSRSSLEHFANRHGYKLIIITEPLDSSRPPAWSKILAIRDALKTHDLVMWLDSDTLILRSDTDIVEHLNHDTDFAWVHHGAELGPNCGVMVFRNTTAVFSFLDDIYAQSDLVDHPFWEQAAIMRILAISHHLVPAPREEPPKNLNTQWLEPRWNAIRQVACNEPIIRHFAGDIMLVRLVSMAEIVLTWPPDEGVKENMKIEKLRASNIIALAQAQITENIARIEALESQNKIILTESAARIKKLESQTERILSSTSWKITSPIRMAIRLSRKMIGI